MQLFGTNKIKGQYTTSISEIVFSEDGELLICSSGGDNCWNHRQIFIPYWQCQKGWFNCQHAEVCKRWSSSFQCLKATEWYSLNNMCSSCDMLITVPIFYSFKQYHVQVLCLWNVNTYPCIVIKISILPGLQPIHCETQPTSIHWLSSSIFPYLSFVRPASVTWAFMLMYLAFEPLCQYI